MHLLSEAKTMQNTTYVMSYGTTISAESEIPLDAHRLGSDFMTGRRVLRLQEGGEEGKEMNSYR